MTADRIVKQTMLRAPLARVWRAISDAQQFGTWFGVELDGPFVAGQRVIGKIVPTKVDAEVAKLQQPHAGVRFEIAIDTIEPMRRFAFRWHPYAIDPKGDFTHEPTTLVEFVLEEAAGGTHLTITESGFDKLPADRRATAFQANDGGWTLQLVLIEKFLAGV
jgi:uncharacterized protein YndB with AHSA1/START domain